MNKRIRELAEQSGCKVMDGEWYIPSATGLEKIVYTKGIGLEKFAELIIRECVKQAHGVADLRGVNEDMVYGADTAAIRIHRYFGVKE